VSLLEARPATCALLACDPLLTAMLGSHRQQAQRGAPSGTQGMWGTCSRKMLPGASIFCILQGHSNSKIRVQKPEDGRSGVVARSA